MNAKKKYVFIVLLFFLFSLLGGCAEKNSLDKDKLDSMIEGVVKDTNSAIANKDIKKARDVWSKVTELSIKAKDLKELSESIEKLSTNYVKLIAYLETNEEYLLEEFKKEFDLALKELREVVYSLTEEK